MATINRAAKEVSVKIVYYGPGLCGKTTNLQQIFDTSNPERRGKLLSVATETDRTLFFDFLPIDLGTIKGMKLKVGLYTVPGQVFYDATRRLVLRAADGVVFVADSQSAMLDGNLESLNNLKTNLALNNLDADVIPLVLQFNKRDLPNALDEASLNAALNWRGVPHKTAVAAKGLGVLETLKEIVKLVMASLNDKVDNVSGSVSAAAKLPAAAAIAAAPNPAPASPAILAPVILAPPVAAVAVPAPSAAMPSVSVTFSPAAASAPVEIMEAAPPPEITEAPISAPAAAAAIPAPVAVPPPPVTVPPLPDPRTAMLARVRMLESQLTTLQSIVSEMKTELAALKLL